MTHDQFRDALQQRGLVLQTASRPTEATPLRRPGARRPAYDGAYIIHPDDVPAGGMQNWADGRGWENWRADIGRPLKAQEDAAHKAKVDAQRRQREAEEEAARERAAFEAKMILDSSTPGCARPRLPPEQRHPCARSSRSQGRSSNPDAGRGRHAAQRPANRPRWTQAIPSIWAQAWMPSHHREGCRRGLHRRGLCHRRQHS